jgi:RNA polymerase sigma-70 factor, ECF subfamily
LVDRMVRLRFWGSKDPPFNFACTSWGSLVHHARPLQGLRHTQTSVSWLAICQRVGTTNSLPQFHPCRLPVCGKIVQSDNELHRFERQDDRRGWSDSLETEIALEYRFGQSASSPTFTSEAQLVTSARNGEQSAYAELCRRHREMVLRTVLRITRNPDEAEDVLQDSWMRAFTHLRTFDGRSAFSTWVTRIAINSALAMIRKKGRHKEVSLDDPIDSDSRRATELLEPSRNPEERCLETERLKLVRQAIMRLPSRLRSAVEVRQSQDGPVSELAVLAGVSLPTMKSRLMRARRKLRAPLSKIVKGIPASDASHRPKRANSLQKTSRLQSRVDKTTVVLDRASPKMCSVQLDGTNNKGQDGHWMICQGSACESFGDAGGPSGQ